LPEGEERDELPENAFHLHEDEWRQIEFIGPPQQAEVEAELAQLRPFVAEHRQSDGFTQVYVREGRQEGLAPLRNHRDALESLLPLRAQRRTLVVGHPEWGASVVTGYAVDIGSAFSCTCTSWESTRPTWAFL
jgi:hypothetical protein